MLLIIIFAAIIAVISYVYKHILAYQPVLNWWFMFGLKFENRWFYKPVWGCELCFSGQLAMWIYILNWIGSNLDERAPFWGFIFFLLPKSPEINYNVFLGVFSVSLSILFTSILTNKLKK